MFSLRHVAMVSALTLVQPAMAMGGQVRWGQQSVQNGYNEGFVRGEYAGSEDRRRGERFGFTDESDYRRGDQGYRPQFGSRDRYRDEFRRGFEDGYRIGYVNRGGFPGSRYEGPTRPPGPVGNEGRGRAIGRRDLASDTGFNDGYQEGLKDGRDLDRFDPIGESRYRSGDHGYDRSYGSRDDYKANYRVAFRSGYEQGYQDGRRYRTR